MNISVLSRKIELYSTLFKYILLFVLSLGFFFFIAYLRSGTLSVFSLEGFVLSSLIGGLGLFIAFFLIIIKCKKLKPIYVFLSLWLGISVLELPLRIFDFEATLVSLPTYLSWCLGLLAGFLSSIFKKWWQRLFVFSLILLITLFIALHGYDLWLNKMNYGSFTGRINELVESPLVFQDQNGIAVNIEQFKGSYLLLDFWNTWCGYCYQSFPILDEMYKEYKDSSIVKVYAVHCWYATEGESYLSGWGILNKYDYSFPLLTVDGENRVIKEVGVTVFPTVLVFSKEGNLIFRGNLEYAREFIDSLLK